MIKAEHLLFRSRDGRACRMFIPACVWNDDDEFYLWYDGDLRRWIAGELTSKGEAESDFDVDAIAEDARREISAHIGEWREVHELANLAADHGVGEPARLMRSRAPEERDWFVPGVIAPGGVTLVGGREKLSGKSTLVFSLVGALERKDPTMFGASYSEAVKTLIITEEPEYAIVDKLNRFDLSAAWVVQDWSWPLDRFEGSNMNEKWIAKLIQVEKLANAVGARHVVVDPLSRIAYVDDESGRELGQRAEAISSMAYRANLAVTLVHHANKASDRAVEDKMRGSTSLTAAVEQIIMIERRDKRRPRERHATSYGRVEEANWERAYELDEDGRSYREIESGDGGSEADLMLLRDLGTATVKQFCEMTGQELSSANRQKVKRRLEKLVEADVAESRSDGRETVYWPAS